MIESVTLEEVRRWKKELDDLRDEEKARRERMSLIERKLEAAALLGLKPEEADAEQSSEAPNRPSLPNAILEVLVQEGQSLAPPEVAQRLLDAGFEEQNLGTNRSYLYASLKKLVDKKKAHKRGKKYRVAA